MRTLRAFARPVNPSFAATTQPFRSSTSSGGHVASNTSLQPGDAVEVHGRTLRSTRHDLQPIAPLDQLGRQPAHAPSRRPDPRHRGGPRSDRRPGRRRAPQGQGGRLGSLVQRHRRHRRLPGRRRRVRRAAGDRPIESRGPGGRGHGPRRPQCVAPSRGVRAGEPRRHRPPDHRRSSGDVDAWHRRSPTLDLCRRLPAPGS